MMYCILWSSSAQYHLHLLIACKVHGMCRPGPSHHGINTSHRVVDPLILDDLHEGICHVTVVVPRVWHKSLHSSLQNKNQNIITKLESVGGRVSSQQWEGWWSTVRWSMIYTVDCWSCGGINSQQWEGQQSTVRQSTINQQWQGQQSTVRWSMINSQQWQGQQSTVRWLMINSQQWGDWWSTLLTIDPGGRIKSQQWEGQRFNSETIDDQQSTVRGSMVNSEAIDNQQSTVRGSTVNSEAIENQHYCLLILERIDNWHGEDQQSIALWVYHDTSKVKLCAVPVKFRCIVLQNVWNLGLVDINKKIIFCLCHLVTLELFL